MKKILEETEIYRKYGWNGVGNLEGERHYNVHYCKEGEEWGS